MRRSGHPASAQQKRVPSRKLDGTLFRNARHTRGRVARPPHWFRRPVPLAFLRVPQGRFGGGMARTRISTTVDHDLLTAVRERRPGASDSSVLEEALQALLDDRGRTPCPGPAWPTWTPSSRCRRPRSWNGCGSLTAARMRSVCSALAVAVDCR